MATECNNCGVIGIVHPVCDDCWRKAQERIEQLKCLVEEATYFMTEAGVPKEGYERAWLSSLGEMNSYLRAEIESIEGAEESDDAVR